MKLSQFLQERKERFKPEEAKNLNLKRLYKIKFNGELFIDDRKTNTNMILIKKNDLVISGINVEKGALNIYKNKEDILATIHYSSYQINFNKINKDYFQIYFFSENFKNEILKQVGGGIKREIKAKTFLNLEISLPNLEIQKQIVSQFEKFDVSHQILEQENLKDFQNIKNLKKSILDDAIKGKLTKQNLNDKAEDLLKKIKEEKQKLIEEKKIRKDRKELQEIKEEEIPFEIPKNWVWCRLGEIFIIKSGGTPLRSNINFWKNGKINWLKSGELRDNLKINYSREKITEEGLKKSSAQIFEKGSILLALYGMTAGKLGILNINSSTNQAICQFSKNKNILKMFLFYFLLSKRDNYAITSTKRTERNSRYN
jgi:type I restriction enzyme S subunit